MNSRAFSGGRCFYRLHDLVTLGGAFLCLGLGVGVGQGPAWAAAGAGAVYYVATNGNDQWSGRLAAPNGEKTDGPFATVVRARDAVRELKGRLGGAAAQAATVYLREGVYFLKEPLVFSPGDSGTAAAPVTFAAHGNEKPVLSGGRRVTGWKPTTVNGRQVWAVDLESVRAGEWFFRQLWVNGQRRVRARHPNKGYLAVEEIPDAKAEAPWAEGQSRFRFKAGDLQAWPTVNQAEVRVMNRWVESHLPVVSVDEAERTVMFSKRSVFKLEPGDLYYIEHALGVAGSRPGNGIWIAAQRPALLPAVAGRET